MQVKVVCEDMDGAIIGRLLTLLITPCYIIYILLANLCGNTLKQRSHLVIVRKCMCASRRAVEGFVVIHQMVSRDSRLI